MTDLGARLQVFSDHAIIYTNKKPDSPWKNYGIIIIHKHESIFSSIYRHVVGWFFMLFSCITVVGFGNLIRPLSFLLTGEWKYNTLHFPGKTSPLQAEYLLLYYLYTLGYKNGKVRKVIVWNSKMRGEVKVDNLSKVS